MSNDTTRRVTVTSCVEKTKADGTVIQGSSSNGPWTMHTVMATTEHGQPIQEDIISFQALPLGDQTVKVIVKNDPKYGKSFTFAPVDGTPAQASTPATEGHEMLRQSIRLLGDRVSALETAVKALGGFGSSLAQTDVPATAQRPVAGPAIPSEQEIPF